MESEKLWTRPKSVAHPTVWRRFRGSKPFPNGRIPEFRVQDLTEDLLEPVLSHMTQCYMRDEPLCKSTDFANDELAVGEQLQIWKIFSKYNMVLVCLLENKEELDDETVPTIAGCNMTGVLLNNRAAVEFAPKSPLTRLVFDLMAFLHDKVDVFRYYDTDEILYALGLSVHPLFRAQGVASEIMKARFQLGKAVGLKATVTVFTNIASQKVAEKSGFETLYEIDYKDYKIRGEVAFKGVATKSIKLMGAKIE